MSQVTHHPVYRLVAEHARLLGRRVAEQAVVELDEMRSHLLSGDDSGLTSTWQEICVQVQGEESDSWDAYLLTIHQVVLSGLQGMLPTELKMLWLCTDQGWNWLWDVVNADDDQPAPPHPGVDGHEIARWIWRQILRDIAEQDHHPNVRRFLDKS